MSTSTSARTAPGSGGAPRRPVVATAVVLAGLLAVAVALLTSTRAATRLADPGAAVRWSLPAADAVSDLALAVTVGALVLTVLAVPATSTAFAAALRVAAVAAGAWTLSGLAVLVLTYASVSGTSPFAAEFGAELGQFVGSFELGRSLLLVVLLAAATTTVAAASTGWRGAVTATVLALAALLPLSLSGHSGGAEGHETAVTSLALHLLALAVWVGGLVTLVLVRRSLAPPELPAVLGRFSALALAAVGMLMLTGVLNAATRLDGLADLESRYGALIVVKTVLLLVLAGVGWWHRRRSLPLLGRRAGAFWRLVLAEVAVMATTVGVAVGLSSTPPPVSDTEPPLGWSPAEVLVGYPMPPEQTPLRLLTEWSPDLFWVLVVLAGTAAYLAGVRRLRARGDAWPAYRTLLWLGGMLVVLLVTSSGLATYGRVLFSTHMLQHMTMSMVAPLLLVPAAPITLALRTLAPRRDGSRGPREWLLAGLHSRASRILTSPVVAAAIFAGSLVAFYYSPLFGLALRTHYGHLAMHLHFLLTGYLFVWSLVGTDPGVRPTPYPLRLVVLFATMAFHAFFGVALLGSTQVLQADYFQTVFADRGWGADPLSDQAYGAGLAWGLGEVPTLFVAVAVTWLWLRDDTRESRRSDRRADRDGDAELTAYNEMLSRLGARRD